MAGEGLPLEGREVGLRGAWRIDADQVMPPALEELKIAGGLEDHHLCVGDVQSQVGIKHGMIDRETTALVF